METTAIYSEKIIKTYGFNVVSDVALISLYVVQSALEALGTWLTGMRLHEIFYQSMIVQETESSELCISLILDMDSAPAIIKMLQEDTVMKKDILSFTSPVPVEVVFFQGPHFGHRPGIYHIAAKALHENNIPLLMASCSGASVHLVFPKGKATDAKTVLSRVFEVPQ